jgi:hypothetical protein
VAIYGCFPPCFPRCFPRGWNAGWNAVAIYGWVPRLNDGPGAIRGTQGSFSPDIPCFPRSLDGPGDIRGYQGVSGGDGPGEIGGTLCSVMSTIKARAGAGGSPEGILSTVTVIPISRAIARN